MNLTIIVPNPNRNVMWDPKHVKCAWNLAIVLEDPIVVVSNALQIVSLILIAQEHLNIVPNLSKNVLNVQSTNIVPMVNIVKISNANQVATMILIVPQTNQDVILASECALNVKAIPIVIQVFDVPKGRVPTNVHQ